MPPKNIEITSAGLFMKSGEKMMELNNLENVEIEVPANIHDDFDIKRLTNSNVLTFTADNSRINKDVLDKLTKVDSAPYVEMDVPYMYIQRRRHKRKRINKKWLKRYGYKIIYKTVKVKVVEIKADEWNADKSMTTDFCLELV